MSESKLDRRKLLMGAGIAGGAALLSSNSHSQAGSASKVTIVKDYDELRGMNPDTYSVGDVAHVTGKGIAGTFILRKRSPLEIQEDRIIENGGTIIVDGFEIPDKLLNPIRNGSYSQANKYWERIFEGALNVKWFGAKGNESPIDGYAIQAAIDSVPVTPDSYADEKEFGGAGRVSVELPAGKYRLDLPLDCSQRDYFKLFSSGRATLIGYHSSYVIDMSSTDHCEFIGFQIRSSSASIGIYINRCVSAPYAMFNVIRNVKIDLGANPTANLGNGSIGIYNIRGEQNLFDNLEIRADLPYWARATASSLPPLFGEQATATVKNNIDSSTVNTHLRCNFIKNGNRNYCCILDNSISFEFINCYWAMEAKPDNIGENVYALLLNGVNRCKFSGSVETNARFAKLKKDNYQNEISIAMQVQSVDADGVINMDDNSGEVGFLNGIVNVLVAGATPAEGATLFKDSGTAETVKIIGNIIKTTSLLAPITAIEGRNISRNIIQRDNELKIDSN